MSNTPAMLVLVVPCFNEEDAIEASLEALSGKLGTLAKEGKISEDSFVGIVDDGSRDSTWIKVIKLKERFSRIKGIKLSTNFGHQNALWAGLHEWHKEADCLISIDADLQDDINVIEKMLEKFKEGADIVYGVRSNRDKDSFFKRTTAGIFYRLMNMFGASTIKDHADFRLASSRVINELMTFREVNLFLRGLFTMVGFKQEKVYYERLQRKSGKTKYPLRKMISFALEGITSFSAIPLRLIAIAGILICFFSLILGAYAFYSYFVLDVVRGWASIVVPMYFMGGVQLLGIGIIGEYLGKVYLEIKQRPRFIVDEKLD